jgi:hypothetical protein
MEALQPRRPIGAAGVELRDGRALLVSLGFFNASPTAYLYDPTGRRWSAASGLAGGGSAAVMFSDGRVFVPEVQQGTPQGRMSRISLGGQIFDPATNQWMYVTTTSVPLPLVYLYAGGLQVAVAVVILQTVALEFKPQVAPPATQLLDSTGLTALLLATALVAGLLMLLAYRRSSRTELTKLG